MAKTYKIILSVVLAVLIAAAVVVVTGVIDINNSVHPDSPTSGNYAPSASYKDTFKQSTVSTLPLMKTDIDNLFFTMSKKGEVAFFELKEGELNALPETGSYSITAPCSSQKIPAVIHYIEKDGKVQGFGLFTTDIYPDSVFIYKYAFFKVTNMFPGFDKKDGTLLLLADVEMERFYSENKIYSEAFYLAPDHTAKYFLSEDQRTVDTSARAKTDYKMFNDSILDQGENENVLFFSSRYYVDYKTSGRVDIFTSGGSGTNVDNIRHITDVANLYFKRMNGATLFFKNSTDGTGFSLQSFDGKQNSVIAGFSGSLKEDYIIDNNYLFSKLTGSVFSILNGNTSEVTYSCFKSDFKADLFSISKNGKYCAVRGANTNNTPAIGLMDLESGKMIAYTDEVFGLVAQMQVSNDGNVVISVATNIDPAAAAYYQLTAKIDV